MASFFCFLKTPRLLDGLDRLDGLDGLERLERLDGLNELERLD